MRTFYIAAAIFTVFVIWLLNKPIPKREQVARAFTDAEIEYLEKSFDYAMDNTPKGEYLDWSVAAVNGRIAAGEEYTSKRNSECRRYVEVARTYEAQKVDSGIACKRQGDKEGWCRIHEGNPETCALEVPESILKKRMRYAIMTGNQTIDRLLSTRIGIDTDGMIPHVPGIKTPYIGPIDTPDIDIQPGDLRPPMPWDANQQ